MSHSQNIPENDLLLQWVQEEKWPLLREAFLGMRVPDICDIIARSDEELHEQLFDLVHPDQQARVLAELQEHEEADELLEALTDEEISDLAEEMSPDDAADVIQELDDARSENVLDLMEDEEADELRALLAYEPESAGGIMTTEVVALHQQMTVSQALASLAELEVDEPWHYVYTVDRNQVLTGYIGLWQLIRLDPELRLTEVKEDDMVSVRSDVDQEEVAGLMRKYDLTSLPVVQPNGRLIGRVTIDDAMDVMEEEATEDMLRMAGTDEADLQDDSPLVSIKSRLPWLLITLLGGCLTSVLMDAFFTHLSAVMVLSLFVPMVMAMGGNTGIQTSIVFVRSMALGTVTPKTVRGMLIRELQSGMGMGAICGVLMAAWVPLVITITNAEVPFHPAYIGLVAGFSLFFAMAIAGLFGGLVPLLFQRLKIDPAVASGPLIITSIDILSLIVYFGVSLLLINSLSGTFA